MSDDLTWAKNRACAGDLIALLRQCDDDFTPPLSSRVDLTKYAAQLCVYAERFEAWDDADLVGCVAIYCNSPDKQQAFVSNVSVLESYRGRGVAMHLLRSAINLAGDRGFARVALEVDAGASAASSLYRKLGFSLVSDCTRTQTWAVDADAST